MPLSRRSLVTAAATGLAIPALDLTPLGRAALADDDLTHADRAIGLLDAKVTVDEHFSLTCSHCAAFSKEVLHAGPAGAGMALKLARNAVGYAWMYAVHEAAELAHRSGVDLALLERAVRETGTFDQAFTPILLGGPEPLPADAPPDSRAGAEHVNRLADKDLAHTLDLAARLGADLPGLEVVRREFHRSMRI